MQYGLHYIYLLFFISVLIMNLNPILAYILSPEYYVKRL